VISKYFAVTLLTTALITGVASAQTATTNADTTATSSSMHKEGEWRASKLVGVNVYNESNEKIGDINDVILDQSGKVANVILGVGGFLGIGEHYVSVNFGKLKWVNETVRSNTTASTSTTSTSPSTSDVSGPATDGTARTTTGAATGTTTTRSASEYWYPDHAMYNATKDELMAMPQFKY